VIIVAHKGASSPENVDRLVRAGATAIELDVHDGPAGPRVTHFAPVWALPGWLERDHRSFRLAGERRGDPLLADLLAWLPVTLEVMLDLKEQLPARRSRLNAALSDALLGRDRISVSTSHVPDLTYFRDRGLGTWRTLSTGWALRRYLAQPPATGEGLSVSHQLLTPAVVTRLTADCGATVLAWTVNDIERALQLRTWGVPGITTDSAAVMQALGRG
jgi:glycerophosphoryl diester phosphodiesterase